MQKILLTITFFLLNVLCMQIYATDTVTNVANTDQQKKFMVKNIVFDGLYKTKEKKIYELAHLHKGDTISRKEIAVITKKLMGSNLFLSVKIYPIIHPDGAIIFIVIREKKYIKFSNYGGIIHTYKYGKKIDNFFLQPYFTISHKNFRGAIERLDVAISFWTARYIGVRWTKKITGKPLYFKIGSIIGNYPSSTTPWHTDFYNKTYGTIGRRFKHKNTISLSCIGQYFDYSFHGDNGILQINNDVIENTKKMPYAIVEPMSKDTDWTATYVYIENVDTTLNDTSFISDTLVWDGFSTKKIAKYEEPFTEAILKVSWRSIYTDKSFNPQKGISFLTTVSSNFLYPYRGIYDTASAYLLTHIDIKTYHRGIGKKHTFAYRIRLTNRLVGVGSIYSGIYMGDETTLRGYGKSAFGGSVFNHRILGSFEYRFPIINLPKFQFPWLTWYDSSMRNLPIRVDGVAFIDAGYIWKTLDNPIIENHQSGVGVGFGLRFMFPTLKQSICGEIAFPIHSSKTTTPMRNHGLCYYLYLNLPF